MVLSIDPEKADGVLESVGLGDLVVGLSAGAAGILDAARQLLKNEAQTRSRLADAASAARQALHTVPELLRSRVREHEGSRAPK